MDRTRAEEICAQHKHHPEYSYPVLKALKTCVSSAFNAPISIHREARSWRQRYMKRSGILRLYKAWLEGHNINLQSQDFLGLARTSPNFCVYLAL